MAIGTRHFQGLVLTLGVACGGHYSGQGDGSDQGDGARSSVGGSGSSAQAGQSRGGSSSSTGASAGRGSGQAGASSSAFGGTASSGGVAVGGGVGTGGVPQAGGPPMPNETGGCPGEPTDSCVYACESNSNFIGSLICYKGRWRCPVSEVLLSTCAPDSCAASHPLCCDLTSGHVEAAACENGKRLSCPVGSQVFKYRSQDVCLPAGVQVGDCASDHLCPVPGYECHHGGSRCHCEGTEVEARWQCEVTIP